MCLSCKSDNLNLILKIHSGREKCFRKMSFNSTCTPWHMHTTVYAHHGICTPWHMHTTAHTHHSTCTPWHTHTTAHIQGVSTDPDEELSQSHGLALAEEGKCVACHPAPGVWETIRCSQESGQAGTHSLSYNMELIKQNPTNSRRSEWDIIQSHQQSYLHKLRLP